MAHLQVETIKLNLTDKFSTKKDSQLFSSEIFKDDDC